MNLILIQPDHNPLPLLLFIFAGAALYTSLMIVLLRRKPAAKPPRCQSHWGRFQCVYDVEHTKNPNCARHFDIAIAEWGEDPEHDGEVISGREMVARDTNRKLQEDLKEDLNV